MPANLAHGMAHRIVPKGYDEDRCIPKIPHSLCRLQHFHPIDEPAPQGRVVIHKGKRLNADAAQARQRLASETASAEQNERLPTRSRQLIERRTLPLNGLRLRFLKEFKQLVL